MLGQEAVADKSNELTAIPALLARLAENDGLRGALVSIDAIATNATIASSIKDAGADYLLAVKANQPTLRAEVEACFASAPSGAIDPHAEHDKGHGRVEQRTTSVMREVDWLSGERRFPGELRLPGVACVIRVEACIQRGKTMHTETRYYISSAPLDAIKAAQAVRGHWAIENSLHWVLDVGAFIDGCKPLIPLFGSLRLLRRRRLPSKRRAKQHRHRAWWRGCPGPRGW